MLDLVRYLRIYHACDLGAQHSRSQPEVAAHKVRIHVPAEVFVHDRVRVVVIDHENVNPVGCGVLVCGHVLLC